MEHQQNKTESEQPPPLLASPKASNGSSHKLTPPSIPEPPATDPFHRHSIPSPPPLQHFPYRPLEEPLVNATTAPLNRASSPESINQLSPRGLTSSLVQMQPLLPSSSGLPQTPPQQQQHPPSSSSMPPSPMSMSLPSYQTHSPSTPPSASGSGYPKKCRFCDKVFEKGYSLQRHERIHTGFKPCYCEVSG